PLLTVSGSLLGFDLAPLRGERDEQREFGLAIPIAGWTLDLSNFRTGARNFFDHDALENNIFIPLTIGHARIRGTEVSVNSPRTAHNFRFVVRKIFRRELERPPDRPQPLQPSLSIG